MLTELRPVKDRLWEPIEAGVLVKVVVPLSRGAATGALDVGSGVAVGAGLVVDPGPGTSGAAGLDPKPGSRVPGSGPGTPCPGAEGLGVEVVHETRRGTHSAVGAP
jgi:hypothetical protein